MLNDDQEYVGKVIATDGLWLRAAPNSTKLELLYNFEPIKVLEKAQNVPGSARKWMKIEVGGKIGWVDARYVEIHPAPPKPQPLPGPDEDHLNTVFWIALVGIITLIIGIWLI